MSYQPLPTLFMRNWEDIITQVMLTSPIVLFAGLGSPSAALLETTRRIKNCLDGITTYQADPLPAMDNAFFQALGLSEKSFIQLGWNDLMTLLGKRVASEHLNNVQDICNTQIRNEMMQRPLTAISSS
jgi:hypothetical protein